ncbi:unnamed protein product [Larinioides sclopetarius]|uniref:Coiled-coil domain-containing protein 86 n=1 Tax=Larinioides sclopetarius TaxID=280406 RepID=A0AAV2B2M1_9ARAC
MLIMDETEGAVMPIKGKPKSGRLWKSEKSRFRSMCQVKPLKSKWKKRLQERQERKDILAHQAELKEVKEQEKELRKQRRRQKLEQKRKNELKSEVVQVIKNTAKIKRMSKKKLRNIQKRDTNPVHVNSQA